MTTFDEFKVMTNNRPSMTIECQVDGSTHRGKTYKKGDQILVSAQLAYTLWKQDDGERWKVTDLTMPTMEMKAINQHLENEKKTSDGELKSIKTNKNLKYGCS